MTKKLFVFISGITLFRLIYAVFLPLAPQEAYYWNYSRHPALSYFDHPPMAAYFIKLTTLFGISQFSIHLAAILLSIPLTIAIYILGRSLFDEWVGFWSAVVINLTFIYAVGATIITPDTPLLLFWALTMIACVMIDRGRGNIWWILLGIFLGAGFDSKYPIVFAALGAFLFLISSRERRRHFRTMWPYLALVAAFIMALPVIYWNYSHDWASFAFQTSRRAGEMTRFRADYFFGFIGTVFAIYGIVPFPLLIAGIRKTIRDSLAGSSNYLLLASFSIPLMLFLIPAAAKSWVKMNWTTPAFIGWFIAAVAFFRQNADSRNWVRIWGKVSFYFQLLAFILICLVILFARVYFGKGDYFSGWDQVAARVESLRGLMQRPYFIMGSEYKISSELAFRIPGHPEIVGQNIIGKKALQYDYWSDPDTLVGYDAICVFESSPGRISADQIQTADFFASIDTTVAFSIERNGNPIRSYSILICRDYKGLKKGK